MGKRILFLLMLIAVSVTALFARDIRFSVTDRDLEIPLEGVMLEIVGTEDVVFTDFNGEAVITIPDYVPRTVIIASIPGYESQRIPVDKDMTNLELEMILSGIIEGKELVVERQSVQKTDEEVGVSQVMTFEEMETTANIGLVEDVMSSIKTLPGVGYTSTFDAAPSIRGGSPNELGCIMDGFYIVYPYHWGGGYTIFNPNMVESAKLSHGIYSARYGRALAGLLEVNTVVPDEPMLRVNGGVASTAAEMFLQFPLGANAGVFMGGKITYMETLALIAPEMPRTPPYIRDFYAKIQYNPVPSLELYATGFFGSDGVGVTETAEISDGSIENEVNFDWSNINTFGSGGFRFMPGDRFILRGVGGVNYVKASGEFTQDYSGSREYSDEFIALHDGDDGDDDGLIQGKSSYTLDFFNGEGEMETTTLQTQGKLEMDFLVGQNSVITGGTEVVYGILDAHQYFQQPYVTQDVDNPGNLIIRDDPFTIDADENNTLNSAAFLLWNFGGDQSRLTGELGLRAEHYYLWSNGDNDMTLNTYPVVNPRAQMTWTAYEGDGLIHDVNLSFGTGLFSSFPFVTSMADPDFGLESFEVKPDQAWFSLVGIETNFGEGWKFQFETYYKYYLSRLYVTADDSLGGDMRVGTEGRGQVYGFDVMIQKKQSRRLDGYLTYTFVIAQYYNPAIIDSDNEQAVFPTTAPVDEWYYPEFHRFHSLNLVLNYKPFNGFTISLIGSLATGNPQLKPGSIQSFYAEDEANNQFVEVYYRKDEYDADLRSQISCPIDIRISYSNYYTNSPVQWEVYFGAEDILTNLYKPQGSKDFDQFTGEEIPKDADFSIGIPLMSAGFKISY